MQSSQKSVVWTVIICSAILLATLFYMNSQIPEVPTSPSADAIAASVLAGVTVPTASEIAAAVNVPGNSLRNDNFDDILEGIYPDEVNDLEDDCTSDLWDEFNGDVLDEIQDLLEAKIGDEVTSVTIVDPDYDDDYDFSVVNLGLSDEEDRAADITTVMRVKYKEVFGDEDWHYDKVYVEASCSDWDEDDNEFDELNVLYTL